jgi:peptide/nickel transport system substrate-binding protein
MREAATRRLAIEKGQVDIVDWMSFDDINALQGKNGIIATPGPTLTVYDVKMNTKNGPTADPALRRAIAYATDYEALAAIWGGRYVLARSVRALCQARPATTREAWSRLLPTRICWSGG